MAIQLYGHFSKSCIVQTGWDGSGYLTTGALEALKSIFPKRDPNHSRIKAPFIGEYLAIKVVLQTTNIGI